MTRVQLRSAAYLRDTIAHAGLSYRQVASDAGIAHATLANLARGGRNGCTAGTAERIATALGLDVDLLFVVPR